MPASYIGRFFDYLVTLGDLYYTTQVESYTATLEWAREKCRPVSTDNMSEVWSAIFKLEKCSETDLCQIRDDIKYKLDTNMHYIDAVVKMFEDMGNTSEAAKIYFWHLVLSDKFDSTTMTHLFNLWKIAMTCEHLYRAQPNDDKPETLQQKAMFKDTIHINKTLFNAYATNSLGITLPKQKIEEPLVSLKSTQCAQTVAKALVDGYSSVISVPPDVPPRPTAESIAALPPPPPPAVVSVHDKGPSPAPPSHRRQPVCA